MTASILGMTKVTRGSLRAFPHITLGTTARRDKSHRPRRHNFSILILLLEREKFILSIIDPDTLVGDIVKLHPITLEIFARHNFDLCCEAGDPLGVAARKHKLDLGRLLEELTEALRAG